MKCKSLTGSFSILLVLLVLSTVCSAEVVLPQIFSNKMVLQQGKPVPVWGWADPGEEVTIQFAGQTKKAMPGRKGKWTVRLDPLTASCEPRAMMISGKNEITIDDVLVGEVWLATGQSNMGLSFRSLAEKEKEFALNQKDNKLVRAFHVEYNLEAGVPMDDTIGRWKDCRDMLSGDLSSVSAVAFFFALKLQQELGVPVAFLDTAWGGQRIERFIPAAGYKAAGLRLRRVGYQRNPEAKEIISKLDPMKRSIEGSIAAIRSGRKLPIIIEDRVFGWSENGLYNAMIAPLTPYGIRGVIWYQGESNRGSNDYFKKLQALSAGFSQVFDIKDIPLYQAQIAPFDYSRGKREPSSTLCECIWLAQYKAADEIPGMGIVPTHDTNIDTTNIHPVYKRRVGERLAALAMKNQYGKDVVTSGPRFAAAKLNGSKVVVSFKGVDRGLTTNDGKAPCWFELSADGKKFLEAKAEIKGNTVELSSRAVPEPKFVRMGWSEVAIPNLSDRNGWPVFAFPAHPVKEK